jgi:uncharacterized membrane protein YjfL (UPF0719 family)
VKSMAPYKEGAYSAATHGLYDSTPKKEKRKKEMIMRYSSWGSISSSAQLVLFDSVVALLRTSEEKEITIRRKSTKPYVKLVNFYFYFLICLHKNRKGIQNNNIFFIKHNLNRLN